jgi:hypothetical protein
MTAVAQVARTATAQSFKRGLELLERVDYRRVETAADREEIYRLRYDAYAHEGAIAPRPDQRLTDRFDDDANSWIFGVYYDGVLASSIRVSVATPEHPMSPAVDAFPELLVPELNKGKVIVDPNRLVADPKRTQRAPELPYLTVRLGYVACSYFNADIGTATVRPEHRAFYRRVFLLNSLCEPRPYPTLTKPLGLMAVGFRSVSERIYNRYPYFRSTEFERHMLFDRPDLPAMSLVRPQAADTGLLTSLQP